jgi:hypothetical protein
MRVISRGGATACGTTHAPGCAWVPKDFHGLVVRWVGAKDQTWRVTPSLESEKIRRTLRLAELVGRVENVVKLRWETRLLWKGTRRARCQAFLYPASRVVIQSGMSLLYVHRSHPRALLIT